MRCSTILAIAGLLTVGLLARPARAADELSRHAFSIKNLPLRQALKQWEQLGVDRVTVAEEVPDLPISLNVSDLPSATILRLIVRSAAEKYAGIAYRRDGAGTVVFVQPVEQQPESPVLAAPPDPRLLQKITLTLKAEPLRDAVKHLLAGQPATYVIEADVPNVPVTLAAANATAFEVLRRVVEVAQRQAPEIEFSRDHGVYRLAVARRDPPNPVFRVQLRAKRVTIARANIPIHDAVGQIFRGSGLQYSLNPNVPNTPVSFQADNLTLEEALQALIRASAEKAPGLTLRQDGDVFILERRGPRAVE